VQKCFLERKRSYLTEKGLFSRKALSAGQRGVRREPDFVVGTPGSRQIIRTIGMARACMKIGMANRAY